MADDVLWVVPVSSPAIYVGFALAVRAPSADAAKTFAEDSISSLNGYLSHGAHVETGVPVLASGWDGSNG